MCRRSRLSEESVARGRDSFLRSPKNSIRCASWKVLRKRLELFDYRLKLLQALKLTNYGLRTKVTNDMLMHDNENFMDSVMNLHFTSVDI
ncbi:hypothetical protein TNCV_1668101 [Trichonephila clavipes]|nr:hypothetical protein TNCV_1668101 [Trichonephila clavipes]